MCKLLKFEMGDHIHCSNKLEDQTIPAYKPPSRSHGHAGRGVQTNLKTKLFPPTSHPHVLMVMQDVGDMPRSQVSGGVEALSGK